MFKQFNLLTIFAILLVFANSCTEEDSSNTVTDIDGNVYHSVKIGTQTWMTENLKTTKYNDGTTIPLVSEGTEWDNLSTPGYCYYNNDISKKNTYGALYNWYTVNSGKLAPMGWHIPTDAEWTTLNSYLDSGGRGFVGLQGGCRNAYGFDYIGAYGNWWSSTEGSSSHAWSRLLNQEGVVTNAITSKRDGFSVRCIRDF